jgi:hypothetical protein
MKLSFILFFAQLVWQTVVEPEIDRRVAANSLMRASRFHIDRFSIGQFVTRIVSIFGKEFLNAK